MGVNVISWLWGDKYSTRDAQRLFNAVRRNTSGPFRFVLFADRPYNAAGVEIYPIENPELMNRSCFCRLRMFDPDWQKRHIFDWPILSLDLDLCVVGPIDDLLKTKSTFKILQGVNEVNPCPFNASVMLLTPGAHAEVWADFSVEAAKSAPYHEFPDDQGWIHYKLPNADGWKAGQESGIYGFQKPGWPLGKYHTDLPHDAKIVSFIGKRKPLRYMHVQWVQNYWRQTL